MRLTTRDEYGNADIIALSDTMPKIYSELSFSETNALTDALNKLAAYEDIGLSPEDVAKKVGNQTDRLTFLDNGSPAYKFDGCVYKNEIARKLYAYEITGFSPDEIAVLCSIENDKYYLAVLEAQVARQKRLIDELESVLKNEQS